MRRFKRGSVGAWLATTCIALAMTVAAVPASADVYDANDGGGTIGTLSVSAGNIVIDTSGTPSISGAASFTGEVEAGEGNGVAVFRFDSVDVSGSATVTITGNRALAIVSATDLNWAPASTVDLSDGVAGGGAGGAGGAGGSGLGTGGAGGATGGTGGSAGGAGIGGLSGVNGTAGGNGGVGTDGASGAPGADGDAGDAGGAGALGSGTAGSNAANAGGGAGSAGTAGTFSGAVANGGAGNTVVVAGGGGGAFGTNAPGTAGSAAVNALNLDGAAGDVGANGGNGGNGGDATAAVFGVSASSLDLVAGPGGAGGGGGGQGAGGQGGGKGGGGAGGAGGGGGGGVDALNICGGAFTPPVPPAETEGRGEDGAAGTAGGNGGNGGNGGTALAGGAGQSGANGGGAILLAAQGLAQVGGTFDVSAGTLGPAAGSGAASQGGALGSAGGTSTAVGGTGGNAITASWRTIDGSNYCTVNNTAAGGAGGGAVQGGNGGAGGDGGASGSSGAGGAGSLGVSGMVKLHGSVVLGASSTVIGGNNAAGQLGKLTLISNSTPASAAGTAAAADPTANAADIETGRTTNPALLNGTTTWYPAGTNPKIGQLDTGAATEGFLDNGTSWNAAQVAADTPVLDDPRVDVVVLESGTDGGVYDGYAQIFIINQMGKALNGVTIDVGNGPVLIPGGSLATGKSFTTTVASLDLPNFVVDFSRLGAELRDGSLTGTGITGLQSSTSGTTTSYTGTAVTLAADALEGLDPYTFTWQRNGTTFTPFSTTPVGVGQEDATIILSGIHLTGGLYKATVNDVTSDPSAETAEIQINVVNFLSTPSVTPTTSTKNLGDTHAISVNVTGGVAPLSYQWQIEYAASPGVWTNVDSSPAAPFVTGATASTLNINVNDEAALEGRYRVIVNDSGIDSKTSNTSTLNVTNFLGVTNPSAVNAYTGEALTLSVSVFGGTPPYTVEWFKGAISGSPIATDNTAPYELNLSPADASDIGTYFARVTDGASDTDNSAGAAVDVRALPTTTNPAAVSGYVGNSRSFSTTASGGYTPYTYEWRLNGSPIVGAPNAPTYNRILALPDNGQNISVRVSDAGGTSGVKTTTSANALMSVVAAPSVTITSSGYTGYVDDVIPTQTLSVTGGFPSKTYAWFLDGVDITTLGGVVNGANGDLTLPASALEGTLTATVTDAGGSEDSDNSVDVLLVEHLTGVTVNDATANDGFPFSNPAILAGQGLPPLSFEWTKDDGSKAFVPLVPAQNGQALVLNPATFADAGVYQVEVSDSGTDGPFFDTFVLTVEEGVPAAGGLGLGALAVLSALGGALALRRRKK